MRHLPVVGTINTKFHLNPFSVSERTQTYRYTSTILLVYLTMLSMSQNIQYPMVELLMNNELGRMWDEAVMA
jgi:hypothetical protein